MNGFELTPGQKLKVNILTDGPKNDQANGGGHTGREEDLGEDTTNTYLHSTADRTALMQKLSRNKDPVMQANQGQATMDQTKASAALRSSNCVLFQNMFDPTQVDLRKDPSFFMDIKD